MPAPVLQRRIAIHDTYCIVLAIQYVSYWLNCSSTVLVCRGTAGVRVVSAYRSRRAQCAGACVTHSAIERIVRRDRQSPDSCRRGPGPLTRRCHRHTAQARGESQEVLYAVPGGSARRKPRQQPALLRRLVGPHRRPSPGRSRPVPRPCQPRVHDRADGTLKYRVPLWQIIRRSPQIGDSTEFSQYP